jgi:hypothetical protein
LPCDAGRIAAFLEKAGFINHADSCGSGQIVGQIGSQLVTQDIGIPVGAAEQVLKAIRIGMATNFGQLPTILAFSGAQQAGQISHGARVRVGTGKYGSNPTFNLGPVDIPDLHIKQVKLGGWTLGRFIYHRYLRG